MHTTPKTFAGCDTAKNKVDVVRRTATGKLAHRTFENTTAGHKKLVRWLGKGPYASWSKPPAHTVWIWR